MSSPDKQARRTVLRAMSAAGAGLALTPSAARAASSEGTTGSGACASDWLPEGPLRVSPADPRYAHLVARGASNRFRGRPDH
ncbi:FAD-linked oxidase, partial [Streptomyces sp. MCAF7]